MEKTAENKRKDFERTFGKVWVDKKTPAKHRQVSSGMTFGGKYVEVGKNGPKQK